MDFRLHVLETVTDSFSDEKKVGSGGYGAVYKVHTLLHLRIKVVSCYLTVEIPHTDQSHRSRRIHTHEKLLPMAPAVPLIFLFIFFSTFHNIQC